MSELGGSLGIYNLENVQNEGEANALKLIHENRLHELKLGWNYQQDSDAKHEETVLESMVPHKNLQVLCIEGHRGANCPSWLGGYLSVENLESLSLRVISWNTLPPLGKLWFVDDLGVESQGLISTLSFQCLKRIELVEIPGLRKWVGNGACRLFSLLEVVIIEDCPELVELPFSHPTCHQAKQKEKMTWFPKLQVLKVMNCPKLVSMPPIPWTPRPCSAEIELPGSGFERLIYSQNYNSELCLEIKGKGGHNGILWDVLDFHNLADLKELEMEGCPPLPLIHLQKLKSLKTLRISSSAMLFEDESHSIGCALPVEYIKIEQCDANGDELTKLLSHFPKLTNLYIYECGKITGLGVVATTRASLPSPSANIFEHAQAGHHQQKTGGENEASAAAKGLLLLPSQLHELRIWYCTELRLLSDSLSNGNARGGLQSLCPLCFLEINGCPKFLSFFSSSASSCFPFPASLLHLFLGDMDSMETLVCLSNLISLNTLMMCGSPDLRGEGLWPIVAQGRLTDLRISKSPKFFTGSELYSSKLKYLKTDDVAGVLTLPICGLLSSSLTKLTFSDVMEVERFTKEQEEILHCLHSLQELKLYNCYYLQRLPRGLTKLTNLKRLHIHLCPYLQLLPKDKLPSSLEELIIRACPGIKSIPKDTLPSSLRILEVTGKISQELKSQCHELRGTIPKIIDYNLF